MMPTILAIYAFALTVFWDTMWTGIKEIKIQDRMIQAAHDRRMAELDKAIKRLREMLDGDGQSTGNQVAKRSVLRNSDLAR